MNFDSLDFEKKLDKYKIGSANETLPIKESEFDLEEEDIDLELLLNEINENIDENAAKNQEDISINFDIAIPQKNTFSKFCIKSEERNFNQNKNNRFLVVPFQTIKPENKSKTSKLLNKKSSDTQSDFILYKNIHVNNLFSIPCHNRFLYKKFFNHKNYLTEHQSIEKIVNSSNKYNDYLKHNTSRIETNNYEENKETDKLFQNQLKTKIKVVKSLMSFHDYNLPKKICGGSKNSKPNIHDIPSINNNKDISKTKIAKNKCINMQKKNNNTTDKNSRNLTSKKKILKKCIKQKYYTNKKINFTKNGGFSNGNNNIIFKKHKITENDNLKNNNHKKKYDNKNTQTISLMNELLISSDNLFENINNKKTKKISKQKSFKNDKNPTYLQKFLSKKTLEISNKKNDVKELPILKSEIKSAKCSKVNSNHKNNNKLSTKIMKSNYNNYDNIKKKIIRDKKISNNIYYGSLNQSGCSPNDKKNKNTLNIINRQNHSESVNNLFSSKRKNNKNNLNIIRVKIEL